jgi:hypothetical protein
MSGWDPNQMRRITFLDGIPDNQVRTLAAQTSFHARKSAQRQLCSVPELAYRLDTGSRVTTTFSSDLCRALRNRCAESNIHGREVGGILVGYSQTTSRLFHRHYQLLMTDVVPVESRDSSSTHVAFDRNAWLKIERERPTVPRVSVACAGTTLIRYRGSFSRHRTGRSTLFSKSLSNLPSSLIPRPWRLVCTIGGTTGRSRWPVRSASPCPSKEDNDGRY